MANKKMLGYGTWMNLTQESLDDCFKILKKSGYDFIDTAYVYENEQMVGKSLKKLSSDSLIPVQSKVWVTQLKDVKKALITSLKKLGLSKIWSYLLHRPHFDMNINISAWKQLIKCQQLGLVETIGVSNYDKDMIEILARTTGVKPAINQIELSVNNFREDRVFYNLKEKIEIQAWSPMGDLKSNLKNSLLLKIAQKYKVDIPTILISYISSQNISLIVKSQSPERTINNAKALKIKLTKEEISQIKELNTYKNKASETFYFNEDEPKNWKKPTVKKK